MSISRNASITVSMSGEDLEQMEMPKVKVIHKKSRSQIELAENGMYGGRAESSRSGHLGITTSARSILEKRARDLCEDTSRIYISKGRASRKLLGVQKTNINFGLLKEGKKRGGPLSYSAQQGTPRRKFVAGGNGNGSSTRSGSGIACRWSSSRSPMQKYSTTATLTHTPMIKHHLGALKPPHPPTTSPLNTHLTNLNHNLNKMTHLVSGPYQLPPNEEDTLPSIPPKIILKPGNEKSSLNISKSKTGKRIEMEIDESGSAEAGGVGNNIYISNVTNNYNSFPRTTGGRMGLPTDKTFLSNLNKMHVQLAEIISQFNKTEYDATDDKPTKFRINKAIEALTIIAQEKTIFQDYMGPIIKQIERAVFLREGEICDILEQKNISSKHLSNLQAINIEEIPYFSGLYQLLDSFSSYVHKVQKADTHTKETIANLQATLEHKNQILKKYELDLNDLKKNAELNKELNVLKYQVSDAQEEFSKMKFDLKECQEENYILIQQVKRLTGEKAEGLQKLQTTETEYEKLKETVSHKIEEYQAMLVKLQYCKTKIENLSIELNTTQDENARLSVRGATRFEELSPRFSNFREVFVELGIEEPKATLKHIEYVPSFDYISALIEHTKELKEKQKDIPKSPRSRSPSFLIQRKKTKNSQKVSSSNISPVSVGRKLSPLLQQSPKFSPPLLTELNLIENKKEKSDSGVTDSSEEDTFNDDSV